MLVLERRTNEEVLIFVPGQKDPIVVQVCKTSGGWVKLGFEAPRSVRIIRREIDEPVDVAH